MKTSKYYRSAGSWEQNLIYSASFAILCVANPLQVLCDGIGIKRSSSLGGYSSDFWILRSLSYEM